MFPTTLLPISLLCLLSLSPAYALPTTPRARDINISHTSSNGTASLHSIDPATLSPELAKAIEGSHININLVGDKIKRSHSSHLHRRAGIRNSTINLTIIDPSSPIPLAAPVAPNKSRGIASKKSGVHARAKRQSSTKAKRQEGTHHNVYVDASSKDGATGGGIHNSTLNINLNTRAVVGDHSILIDSSSLPSSSSTDSGIEGSVINMNVLPPRALPAVGDHSILIDSSSSTSSSSSAGTHSAVVDTSNSKGILDSEINMTVVSPPSSDDAPAPLVKRASAAWTSAINSHMVDLARRRSLGLEQNVRMARVRTLVKL